MVGVSNASEDANANLLKPPNIAQPISERSESPDSCDHRQSSASDSGYPLEPLAVSLSREAFHTTNAKQTERLGKSPMKKSRWCPSFRLRIDLNRLIVKWWIWELLGCFGSLFSFFAIVGVLKRYDRQAQPEWPYSVTINSVVSWLTTVMKSFLLFSVAACIGQANWLHFRSKPQALIDLAVYDSASRGPLGSLQLLWSLRAKTIASLGAIITILAIGIDPTVQQTIAIRSSPRNSSAIAMLGRAQSFLQYGEVDVGGRMSLPVFEMLGAIYAGAFLGSRDSDSNLKSLDVIPTCSTGNCTFPPFQSLAICSSCENITAALNKTCYNDIVPDVGSNLKLKEIYCHLSLPNGLKVNASFMDSYDGAVASSGYLAPVGRPKYGNSLLNFSMITGRSTYRFGNQGNIGASATQCSLYWCVNQYESRVENGRLHEETTGSWHSETTQWVGELIVLKSRRLELVPSGLDETSTASAFIVPFLATDSLSSWLAESLSFSNSHAPSVGNSSFSYDPDVSSNISSVGILKSFLDSDLSLVFPHLAKSMTSKIRSYDSSQQSFIDMRSGNWTVSGVGPVIGTTHYNEIHVSVRWTWLVFSGALVGLTVIHLIFTVIDTARHDVGVWKLSPIALLFHGLDESETDQLRKTCELASMEALASQIDVQLGNSGGGFKFMR